MPARKTPSTPTEKYLQDALACAQAAIEKKGIEPVLIDLSQTGSYTDYLLVSSAHADRGVRAVAEGIIETMQTRGVKPLGVEGLREGRWALIDFGPLVAHVFLHSLREFYDLEGLWFDTPRVQLQIPKELRLDAQSMYSPSQPQPAPRL